MFPSFLPPVQASPSLAPLGRPSLLQTRPARDQAGRRGRTCSNPEQTLGGPGATQGHWSSTQPRACAASHPRPPDPAWADTRTSSAWVLSVRLLRTRSFSRGDTEITLGNNMHDPQKQSSLPSKQIPIFDGDPLGYQTFMKAIKHGIENKTCNEEDNLF